LQHRLNLSRVHRRIWGLSRTKAGIRQRQRREMRRLAAAPLERIPSANKKGHVAIDVASVERLKRA
jgi:hypothetical protein